MKLANQSYCRLFSYIPGKRYGYESEICGFDKSLDHTIFYELGMLFEKLIISNKQIMCFVKAEKLLFSAKNGDDKREFENFYIFPKEDLIKNGMSLLYVSIKHNEI